MCMLTCKLLIFEDFSNFSHFCLNLKGVLGQTIYQYDAEVTGLFSRTPTVDSTSLVPLKGNY